MEALGRMRRRGERQVRTIAPATVFRNPEVEVT
jgi:hypothetical protein